MRESRIEKLVCEQLERDGYPTLKLGDQGWPDRIIFGTKASLSGGRHIFVEFKKPKAPLTKAQQRRIPKLRKRGEVVLIIDDFHQWSLAAMFLKHGHRIPEAWPCS